MTHRETRLSAKTREAELVAPAEHGATPAKPSKLELSKLHLLGNPPSADIPPNALETAGEKIVEENEQARFEIEGPEQQDQDSIAPLAATSASEGGGSGARLPSNPEEGAGDEEARDPASQSAVAPGSSADHAFQPLEPPAQPPAQLPEEAGAGHVETEEPQMGSQQQQLEQERAVFRQELMEGTKMPPADDSETAALALQCDPNADASSRPTISAYEHDSCANHLSPEDASDAGTAHGAESGAESEASSESWTRKNNGSQAGEPVPPGGLVNSSYALAPLREMEDDDCEGESIKDEVEDGNARVSSRTRSRGN